MLKIQYIQRLQAALEKAEEEEKKSAGSFSQTGRLGETFSESVEVVKIAVFNMLHSKG